MASEIQTERANQAQELRDMQESYRKRRQAIEEDGQAELQRLIRDNSLKIKDEQVTSEAAVNHLRNENKDNLESLRKQSEQAITYERNAVAKRYQTNRQEGDNQIKMLSDNLNARESQLAQNLNAVTKKEGEVRAHESSLTQNIEQEAAARRAQVVAAEQQELANAHEKAQELKAAMNRSAQQEVAKVSEKNREEIQQLRDIHKKDFEKQSNWAASQLKEQETANSNRIESERTEFSKNQAELHKNARQELSQETQNEELRLNKTREDYHKMTEAERLKGNQGLEQTRAYYDKNIARVHKTGDEKFADEKQHQEEKVRLLKTEDKMALADLKAEHEEDLKNAEALHQQQRQQAREFYKNSLVQQHREYDKAFKENIKSFEETVKRQRDELRNTLAREKREVVQDVGRYNSKNSDPFYQITEPAAQLTETPSHYIVRARVPEHEKENINVVVHDDKIVVHGARRFEDSVEDADGKLATHNYQTFRQEIPLEHPVRDKLMQKSYDNGMLTVRIPKA